MANPNPNSLMLSSATLPSTIAKGITTQLATAIPRLTAWPPSITFETLPPMRIYAARNVPASKAKAVPSKSSLLSTLQGAIKKIPAAASNAHKKSNAFLELDIANTRGPRNSNVTANPKGIRDNESVAVPVAPISGNIPLAIAAPPCTLTMANNTAGTGGIFLSFISVFLQS
ncbi:hypothetical protein COLO4_01922 [Corchorus olitorius]|uniref:Uncharacterized protein n=1 Tax=Corchorus olitorius TaxID=93759 RepID=A0A1R3L1S3_9ROSI|nr:hypothetical protein COLO4_01922 [Corchorus olitorius]